jgi:hypothetical protein
LEVTLGETHGQLRLFPTVLQIVRRIWLYASLTYATSLHHSKLYEEACTCLCSGSRSPLRALSMPASLANSMS